MPCLAHSYDAMRASKAPTKGHYSITRAKTSSAVVDDHVSEAVGILIGFVIVLIY